MVAYLKEITVVSYSTHWSIPKKKLQVENKYEPAVVFCIEKEVGANNGDADGDDGQNHVDQQHEAVHIVNLVGPEGGKDEVPSTKEHATPDFTYPIHQMQQGTNQLNNTLHHNIKMTQ